jgi:hypothetical protein
MKTRRSFWVVVALLLVFSVLSVATATAAGATVVAFEGEEYLEQVLVPPAMTETGNSLHGRGAVYLGFEDANNSCIKGYSIITSNANENQNGHGHYWGTFQVVPLAYAGAGTWEANWHGTNDGRILIFGHGTGVFQGMSTKWELDVTGDEAYIPFTGTIHVPANAEVDCTE